MIEFDAPLRGGTLHCYDTGGGPDDLVVLWQHGTPNLGPPPEPLFGAARRLGIRWVSFDRPGYGGSTVWPERAVVAAAECAEALMAALGVGRFAVMGHSGGGPHALACAAPLPDRVTAVVSCAGLAPRDAAGLDWYEGMAPSGVASLRAAEQGRAAKERHEASNVDGDIGFTAADEAALAGVWGWFGSVVGPAIAAGPGGLIDDDLAYVNPWGFDPAEVTAPVLLVHGEADRVVPCAHSRWLAGRCREAELWLRPGEGHISVLEAAEAALTWLRERSD